MLYLTLHEGVSVVVDSDRKRTVRDAHLFGATQGACSGRTMRVLLARSVSIAAGAGLALSLGVAGAAALDAPSGPEAGSASASAAASDAQQVRDTTTVPSSGVVDIARQYVGVPYLWGGSTPAGFDCSGFVQHVFMQVGVELPRTADVQAGAGYEVSAAEARAGDLVWWPGHIGIYTGDSNHIAARSPGTLLHESPIHRANATFIRVFDGDGEAS